MIRPPIKYIFLKIARKVLLNTIFFVKYALISDKFTIFASRIYAYGQCSLKLDVLLDKKNIILTMRRYLFSFILTVIFCVSVTAQKKYSVYGIGFYNQENLFDYTHDEGKKDMDFTPDGSYKWNKMKYESKLHNDV